MMEETIKKKQFCQSCQTYIDSQNMVRVRRVWRDTAITSKRSCIVLRCKRCLKAAEKRKREMGIK